MDGLRTLFFVAAVAGTFYFVKNIKISVSGAEAVESSYFEDSEDIIKETTIPAVDSESFVSKRVPSRKSPQKPTVDPSQQLVEILRSGDLCHFLDFSKENGLDKKAQVEALAISLGEDRFKELTVFLDGAIENFDQYQTLVAQSYLLAKDQKAFVADSVPKVFDFTKGLQGKHTLALARAEELADRDPGNLFFAMLRNDSYHDYYNVDEQVKRYLYSKVMATSRYENPVHSLFREIYLLTKNNVVQFYLAQTYLFNNPVDLQHSFVARSIWNFYDEEMRYHINDVLGKSLEDKSTSAKSFSYEPGVYEAYRNSLHFRDVGTVLEAIDYEQAKVQPTYTLEQLKLDLSERCDPESVNELRIKLRAL